MRPEIEELTKLGPLPTEQAVDVELIRHYESLIHKIQTPVTDEEATALTTLFGNDSCFGLAWTLINIIETAPSWPLEYILHNTDNEWIQLLIDRSRATGNFC